MGGVEDCVDESQLRFVSGWGCGFTGLMLEDCLGCSGESQFCCLTERCCCKAGQPALGCEAPKGEICQLGCGIISCGCKNCMGSSDKAGCSCIQSQTQLCCIVRTAQFQPPTRSHACVAAVACPATRRSAAAKRSRRSTAAPPRQPRRATCNCSSSALSQEREAANMDHFQHPSDPVAPYINAAQWPR